MIKSCIYNPTGEVLELDYMADSIFHATTSLEKSSSPVTIRIYGGGDSNNQTMQLKAAIQELNIHQSLYTIETLTSDDVNMNQVVELILERAFKGR